MTAVDMPDFESMSEAEMHDYAAHTARRQVATYRSYLDFSREPAQRKWAIAMADAWQLQVDAEQRYARALRAREVTA